LPLLAGTLFGGLAGHAVRHADRAPPRRLISPCARSRSASSGITSPIAGTILTGGFDGLRDFHREPIGFGRFTFDITQGETRFYFFLLAIFAVAVGLMGLLLRSPFGRHLVAIRENERRARSSAFPVERHVWMSFSISCFIAALAGTALCAAQQISPIR